MAFIFRKSMKIAPGVKLNFSKSGLSSVSFGGKGGRVTVGAKRTTTTVGIPGTGIRYQHSYSNSSRRNTVGLNKEPKVIANNYNSSAQTSTGTQLGCCSLLIGGVLFLGFLMGGNPDWAIGSLAVGLAVYVWGMKGCPFFKRGKIQKQ